MSTDNTDQDKDKVVDALVGALKSVFEADQDKPDQYVVQYLRKSDNTLIGYHASSFCQLTDDRLSGKRYNGDNPYDQLAIIHKNITSVLATTAEDTGLFAPLRIQVKNTYFDGLTIDDIYLQADYLDEDTPKQTFVFKKVE